MTGSKLYCACALRNQGLHVYTAEIRENANYNGAFNLLQEPKMLYNKWQLTCVFTISSGKDTQRSNTNTSETKTYILTVAFVVTIHTEQVQVPYTV